MPTVKTAQAEHFWGPIQVACAFLLATGELRPVTEIAPALAVLVEDDDATVRVTSARDAVQVGDRIAPHR